MRPILEKLKALNDDRHDEIELWLASKRAQAAPYLYTSVDLRHSGVKLAPVDTNLFPAGFNNLSPAARARASRFLTRALEERFAGARRVLIIPENHTRNLAYLENLVVLTGIVAAAGYEVRLGSLAAEAGQALALTSLTGAALTQFPLWRDGDRLRLEDGFTPDVVVMNNDMTSGAPPLLSGISQPIWPPVSMGWWQRRKGVHFSAYSQLATEFCKSFSLDPWLLTTEFHRCGVVDFKERRGLDMLARVIDKVLQRTRHKYEEYGIGDAPYAYVKADSGTYGMGIITVRAPEDIFELNKKERNKMQVIKEGTEVGEVLIQEGVPTIDQVDGKPAEPMVYMIDGVPIGGMFRVNGNRDALGNLNASGMEFTGMCDEVEDECGQWKVVENCHFRSFGIVAALAALAAAREDYSVGRDGAGI